MMVPMPNRMVPVDWCVVSEGWSDGRSDGGNDETEDEFAHLTRMASVAQKFSDLASASAQRAT
jgi:hypothetical protein